MKESEIIELIAEVLELEIGDIDMSTLLADLPEYDSMAKLSVIVLMDEEFEKKLSGEAMEEFKRIGDMVAFAQA
jgi:acyl carrier protein